MTENGRRLPSGESTARRDFPALPQLALLLVFKLALHVAHGTTPKNDMDQDIRKGQQKIPDGLYWLY
jgi:hypothetical protein